MPCECGSCGKMVGLAHIGIMSSDMERSLDFYVAKLGLELTNRTMLANGTELAFCNVGTCLIELVAHADPSGIIGRPAGIIDHIAIEVTDIDGLVCRLFDNGVNFPTEVGTMPTLLGGVKNIFFQGPDGERIEFFEYLNK